MKLTAEPPFANPEAAARKLVEIASGIEAGRIFTELVNAPVLKAGGTGDAFRAAVTFAEAARLARDAQIRDLYAAAKGRRLNWGREL